ncbi:unnamed protein product [Rhizoctonia solani]|uniref:Fungal-type protein kinase domain-containing protein n=1 Tax=Rhizoctonia solani TaxID=456999 RepID=A0A8H3H2F3_9AGAM|nr:unnamed protein product [Rhizoctonia solani]
MDAVLPTVSPKQLDSVCEKLISDGVIYNSNTTPRWIFLQLDPNVSKISETKGFKFFKKIFKAVAAIYPGILGLMCLIDGNSTPHGSRDNSSRPDGFLYLNKGGKVKSKISWANVMFPMEFKNRSNMDNSMDDYLKLLWSMHHIMRTDARRRFVFGLTCENTKARLWYHDRCDIVGSTEFDINKDWRHLVRIFLSMLLATFDELGFDPDVVLLCSADPDAEPSYDIQIHNSKTSQTTVYRTLRIVSNPGADGVLGRGTRVWVVRKLINGKLVGSHYILKDVWIPEDSTTEYDILEDIRKAQPNYAQYFLTPFDHGFARFSDASPDPVNTHKNLRRVAMIATEQTIPIHPSHATRNSQIPPKKRHSAGRAGDRSTPGQEGYRDFCYLSEDPRQHYRILFMEIGEQVHSLRDWTSIFTAIQGAWNGLHAMNLCGYIHRDRGVIIDLEYAKRLSDTGEPHEVKTGTTEFMATEVAYGRHYRLQALRDDKTNGLNQQQHLRSQSKELPEFNHNPLHDMEQEDIQERSHDFDYVFSDHYRKREFLTDSSEFKKWTKHLEEVSSLVKTMDKWLTALNGYYLSSYGKQDTLKAPLNKIRIDDGTLKLAFDDGSKF